MNLTTIKVSKRNRERLAHIARQQSRTLDQALDTLLDEHERTVQAHLDAVEANEARMAEIRRRREQPLHTAVPHDKVLDAYLAQSD
jgi:transposase